MIELLVHKSRTMPNFVCDECGKRLLAEQAIIAWRPPNMNYDVYCYDCDAPSSMHTMEGDIFLYSLIKNSRFSMEDAEHRYNLLDIAF